MENRKINDQGKKVITLNYSKSRFGGTKIEVRAGNIEVRGASKSRSGGLPDGSGSHFGLS